jgi:hypothetical protein
MYADPLKNDQLNLGFGTLRGDWRASYGHFLEQNGGGEEKPGRLEAEVDERFGAGAFVVMREQYDVFLAAQPQRFQAQYEERERETQRFIRAIEEYRARTGHDPGPGARYENGRIVD